MITSGTSIIVDGPLPVSLPAGKAWLPVRIEVASSFERIADEWQAFEADAVLTPYQSFEWLLAWQKTIGAATGVVPLLCRIYDTSGALIAILPFGKYRRGPINMAGWLGDKHMNYFMGLFDRRVDLSRIDWKTILLTIGRASGIDLFQLKNQPANWNGLANPIACLPSQESPSQAFSTNLTGDFESFMQSRKPGRWKRQLRSKMAKLSSHGEIRVERFVNCRQAETALGIYLDQKARRLAELGLSDPFQPGHVRAFFKSLVQDQKASDPLLEFYTLKCDKDVLAVYAGSSWNGRFSTSICSITDGPLRRYSPGEQLLKALIEDRLRRGDTVLDMGVGESRYKRHWCPDTDGLFDTFLAVNLQGHLGLGFGLVQRRAKRLIKQSSFFWNNYLSIRSAWGALSSHLISRAQRRYQAAD